MNNPATIIIFLVAILIFFAESLSTHKAVETKWSLFFDLGLFSSLKITFNQSGGHFEFLRWPFWIFFADSLSTHKAVETKCYLFFNLGLFSSLKITFNQSGGHFEFLRRPFWIFFLRNLYLLTKLWKQSCICCFI